MDRFSAIDRSQLLKEASTRFFDLIIIGGGITGAGIFLDAQSRGLSCCLLEMQDFAEGTSSRSTRLIHGGLRYLKQWNFKLVSETGKERTIVQRIARHLTYPKKIIVPATVHGNFSKIQLSIALWLYEWLAGVPKNIRHKTFSTKEILEELPNLNSHELLGAVAYTEFQTNDARLTLENIKTGVKSGGLALNKVKVNRLVCSKGKVGGVLAKDVWNGEEFEIKAKSVVNATGAWADQFLSEGSPNIIKRLRPSKGVHLVFSKKRFLLNRAVYFDAPDGRMIFAIPENEVVYLGTTDTFYEDDIKNVTIETVDVEYLLNAANHMFPGMDLKNTDLVNGWAGVRPLLYQNHQNPSEISRRHEIFREKNGLLSIVGGKLTGYRKMAEKMVDSVIDDFFKERQLSPCNTANIALTGSNFKTQEDFEEARMNFQMHAEKAGWQKKDALWVFHHYGDQSFDILEVNLEKTANLPLYLHKTLVFSLKNEMVLTAADFLIRRTNLFYFHPELVKKQLAEIVAIIADFLDLNHQEMNNQIVEIEKLLATVEGLKQVKEKDLENR